MVKGLLWKSASVCCLSMQHLLVSGVLTLSTLHVIFKKKSFLVTRIRTDSKLKKPPQQPGEWGESHRNHVLYARSQASWSHWLEKFNGKQREASVLCNTIGLPVKLFVCFFCLDFCLRKLLRFIPNQGFWAGGWMDLIMLWQTRGVAYGVYYVK